MEKIRINTEKEYYCLIGEDAFEEMGSYLPRGGKKAAIIWDENVGVKIVSKLGAFLEQRGLDVIALSVEGGEKLKSLKEYEKIVNYLIEFGLDRNDAIYAIGGGTVGDLAGFIASTYKRGVKLVQIPTTVLSACDSSVGGKTALNLDGIKNVIGTFYQPDLVVINPLLFDSLSTEIFKEGVGEIIKYGMISDGELLDLLTTKPLVANRHDHRYVSSIIFVVLGIKAKIVAEDEYDTGIRNVLNFGHTLGHAIEAESNFSVSHGKAVAAGMLLITEACSKKGISDRGTFGTLERVLMANGIDINIDYDIASLLDKIETDKKVRGNSINAVLPKKPGKCYVNNMPISEFRALFAE